MPNLTYRKVCNRAPELGVAICENQFHEDYSQLRRNAIIQTSAIIIIGTMNTETISLVLICLFFL